MGGELTDPDWTDMWRRKGAGGSDPFKFLQVVYSCTLIFVKEVKGDRIALSSSPNRLVSRISGLFSV